MQCGRWEMIAAGWVVWTLLCVFAWRWKEWNEWNEWIERNVASWSKRSLGTRVFQTTVLLERRASLERRVNAGVNVSLNLNVENPRPVPRGGQDDARRPVHGQHRDHLPDIDQAHHRDADRRLRQGGAAATGRQLRPIVVLVTWLSLLRSSRALN